MSTSTVETGFNASASLHDLVKKILIAFCEVHVSFDHRLDIYGSIHVRSDDSDLTCFILNEHSYKQTDLQNKEPEFKLTRFVSTVSGNSAVETVCHENSNILGQLSSARNIQHKTVESCTRKLLLREPDNGPQSRKVMDIPSGKVQNTDTEYLMSSNADQDIKEEEQTSEMQDSLSEESKIKSQDASVDANPWPESSFDAEDNEDSSMQIPNESRCTAYIKSEHEQNVLSAVKSEPANENDIIDLGSDEESYEQSNEEIHAHSSSNYDRTGLYTGYSSSAVSGIQADGYNQVAWMQSNARYLPQDDVQFAAMKSVTKSLPQKVCSFCLKCFSTNLQLRLHTQRFHSTPPATEAGKTGWRKHPSLLSSASANSETSSDKILTCSICMLSFRSLDGLRCHENSKHSRNKLYSCQFCSEVFLTRQAAYTHRTKFHRMKLKKTENSA